MITGERALDPCRGARSLAAILVAALAWLPGCNSNGPPRAERPLAEMIASRDAANEQHRVDTDALVQGVIARNRAEYDAYVAGRTAAPPVVDILVISGGGDRGAFGAGVLQGWGRTHDPAFVRPEFDVVTGVSTGALIAPFAFLGDDRSIDEIVTVYRNPREDWIRRRGLFAFLSGSASIAELPGLEAELRGALDRDMLQRLAAAGRGGRILVVTTSDLDYGEVEYWNLVAEAQRALDGGDPDRLHEILLASSALPGLFPPREIDGRLFVDGGVTGNILFGALPGEDSFVAHWLRAQPGIPVPKIRYWIIFNNQLRPPPEVIQPQWTAVVQRSTGMAVRSATVNSIRHLFVLAENARLKRDLDVEVRFIAVPDNWVPPNSATFDREVMNALADLGERMGADPSSWQTRAPEW